MNQLLQPQQTVQLVTSGTSCVVAQFLGGGGQGEVYRATVNGKPVALKWYFPNSATPEQRAALETSIKRGAPTAKFLWPLELAASQSISGFGYIMPLREPRYKSLFDLMKRKIEPSFRALATAGLELAHSFLQLHAKGLCYRDISFGNVFFDPTNGDILICDNDNVTVDGDPRGGVLGTQSFMSPEIVRGEALPSTQTDLYSLAVLLFYLFIVHHPLDGEQEAKIKCFDAPARNKLYGTEARFIFDPQDASNRPVPGYHDNALVFWPIYPQFLCDLFTKAFTDGISDPAHGRVRESEWRSTLARLRDTIIYCGQCGAENFYDLDALKTTGSLKPCWSCNKTIQAPPRIRFDKQIVMLNYDSHLFPHHIDPQRPYDFTQPLASVNQHPQNPSIWGLKNLSVEKWVTTAPDGTIKEVEPGKSVTLATGTKINFGKVEGEIRV